MKHPNRATVLRKIIKHITEKPRRFQMYGLILRRRVQGSHYYDDAGELQKFDSCGTAACIAGWTCLLTDGMGFRGDAWERAQEILGLTDLQADRLFIVDKWSRFGPEYENAKTPRQRALIAAKRIRYFIRTGR